ncbi:CdaR family transcriptional regulator [Aeromicrobium alkaliterrae]|uniref:Sugar diacid utilization regulator n=1 Tax=Aeromicrobium alkaliterrae TaxID=302168 RepID=A0ABN2JG29_9ACTN
MTGAAGPSPLSSEFAQEIVDTLAPHSVYNVNIMDEHGVIIASLDPDRIGTFHQAAQQALAEDRVLNVDQPAPGSSDRPGVNVPLRVGGRLVGVVGLTGEPSRVAPAARFVGVAVELLISRELERERAVARQTRSRDFVAALASGTSSVAELAGRAEALDLRPPWTLFVESPAPEQGRVPSAEVTTILHGSRWTVAPVDVAQRYRQQPGTRLLRIDVADLSELVTRAEEARAISDSVALMPEAADDRWRWDVALAVARLGPRSRERLAARVVEPVWSETVLVLAESRSLRDAAAELHVHRNTLGHRLTQIERATGVDPRQAAGLFTLLMAVYAGR